MLLQRDVEAPSRDRLTGTNGEPALHCHAPDLTVRTTPGGTLLSDVRPVELFVTSESLQIYAADTSTLLTLAYAEVVLHALSSAPVSLYLQLEGPDLRSLFAEGREVPEMLEMSLVPTSDATNVAEEMFAALSRCAAMHPDPIGPDGEGDDDDDAFAAMMGDPNHRLITADSVEGQFDDVAEEGEEVDPAIQTNGHGEGEEGEGPRKWRRTA